MKTLFVSFVAFLFALMIGCQESPIDPVSNNPESSSTAEGSLYFDKDIIHEYPGVINFAGTIFDPSHTPHGYAKTVAAIRFRVDPVPEIQDPPLKAVKVKLYAKAELKGGCFDRPWTVNNFSEDIIYPSSGSLNTYSLEKSFRVCNTCCACLNLVLRFKVYKQDVSLVSIQLKKVPGLVRIPDPIN
jgi:hypothetical protein